MILTRMLLLLVLCSDPIAPEPSRGWALHTLTTRQEPDREECECRSYRSQCVSGQPGPHLPPRARLCPARSRCLGRCTPMHASQGRMLGPVPHSRSSYDPTDRSVTNVDGSSVPQTPLSAYSGRLTGEGHEQAAMSCARSSQSTRGLLNQPVLLLSLWSRSVTERVR